MLFHAPEVGDLGSWEDAGQIILRPDSFPQLFQRHGPPLQIHGHAVLPGVVVRGRADLCHAHLRQPVQHLDGHLHALAAIVHPRQDVGVHLYKAACIHFPHPLLRVVLIRPETVSSIEVMEGIRNFSLMLCGLFFLTAPE